MNSRGNQRLGLVLVSGDTSLSLRFSTSVGRLAKRSEVPLFVFSAGLPTKEQIEGREFAAMILFADPLLVEEDDLVDLSLFGPIPCILVNFRQKGFVSLTCDPYSATRALLDHCLDDKRQIACMQGPLHNSLAIKSFQAYRDMLADKGLPLDFKLVSDIGIRELIEHRALVPGTDFDALCCFGDEQALSLSIYLEDKGSVIPIVVVGSRGGGPYPSVVLPISQMALSAWEMALSGLGDDHVFDCSLYLASDIEQPLLFTNKQALVSSVVQGHDLDEEDAETIRKFVEACASLDESVMDTLEQSISQFLAEGGSLLLLQRLLVGFSQPNQPLFSRLLLYGATIQASMHDKRQSFLIQIEKTLREKPQDVAAAMDGYLAVSSWFVVQQHVRSRVIAGMHGGAGSEEAQLVSFDSDLLPPSLAPLLNEGCWLSIPLDHGSKAGYLLLQTCFIQTEQVLLLKALFSGLLVAEEDMGSEECIVAIGDGPADVARRLKGFRHVLLQTHHEFFPALKNGHPALVIVETVDTPFFNELRSKAKTASTPIVLVKEAFTPQDAEAVMLIPHLIMVHSSVATDRAFLVRIASIIAGESQNIPTMTAALVKGAVGYIDAHAQTQFSRWELADAVNASEDYLGRVFRKEMGLPLWDYLHIHRIALATDMLKKTPLSITEIAYQTGFKDLAYFSRVFRKIMGFPPSQLHSQQRSRS